MRIFAAAPALMLATLLGCADRGGGGGGGDGAVTPGGTLVIAAGGSGTSPMIPPLVIDATGRAISDQLFDRLAEISPDLNTVGDRGFRPRLASSWQWAPDSMSIAFAIDPQARWHDGQPVRASDVKFTLDLNKDPKSGSTYTPTLGNVDSVSVRDSLTAVAWFHKRSPEQFYEFVYNVWVLPEHVLKDTPRDKLGTSDFARRPIGSNRFRFVQFEPSVRLELVADTANYRGRPKLDRVIWAFAADAGAAITQTMSGQADLYENLPPPVIAQMDTAAPVRLVRYPGFQYAFLGFNMRDPRRHASPHPIFADRAVRRAISMGLDRQAMLKNVFDTLGVLGSGPYPKALADTSVKLPAFDRAAASAILDSAGWRMGADGIRSRNGRPLAFTLMVPTSSSPRMKYSVLLQEQLKALGARVQIESMDINAFLERQNAYSFDAALMSAGTDPTRGTIKQNWGTEGTAKGGQNYTTYTNRTFDALVDSSVASFDPDKAAQYYRRAVQTIVDDAPAVWLYDVLTVAGIHKRIRPEEMRADAWWAALPEWWIPANARIDRDKIGLRPAQP